MTKSKALFSIIGMLLALPAFAAPSVRMLPRTGTPLPDAVKDSGDSSDATVQIQDETDSASRPSGGYVLGGGSSVAAGRASSTRASSSRAATSGQARLSVGKFLNNAVAKKTPGAVITTPGASTENMRDYATNEDLADVGQLIQDVDDDLHDNYYDKSNVDSQMDGKADKLLSGAAGNLLELSADGNYRDSGQTISSIAANTATKANLLVSGFTAGNIATIAADGNYQDSGIDPATLATKTYVDSAIGDAGSNLSDAVSNITTSIATKADLVIGAAEDNFASLTATGNLADSGFSADSFAGRTATIDALAVKADKVAGATGGNFAGLDANGNLTDSGKKAADFVAKNKTVTTGNFAAVNAASGEFTDSGFKAGDFATAAQGLLAVNAIPRVTNPTAGHIVKLDASGNLVDGGTLGSMAGKSGVTSEDINDGTIMNVDISPIAQIAREKLSDGVQDSLALADNSVQKSTNGVVPVENNLAMYDASGNLTDSGESVATLKDYTDVAVYNEEQARIADVDAEEAARILAISNEAAARTAADTALSNALAQEISDRIADVNAEEAARILAVSNEAATRSAADTALSNALTQEISDRTAAIAAEAAARTAADTTLSNALAQEISDRTLAISNEVSARSAADTALSNALTAAIAQEVVDRNTAILNDAVQTVVLASGTAEGTLKITVDGATTDNVSVKDWAKVAHKMETYPAGHADAIVIRDTNGDVIASGTNLADIADAIANAVQNVAFATGSTGGSLKITVNGVDKEATVKDWDTKADKVISATNNNFAGLNAAGNLTDSGKNATSFIANAASAVLNSHIADDAVQTGKIKDLNITTNKLADSAVTSIKIADGTIATVDISDGAITLPKINATAYDTAVTSASAKLITSGGVYTAIQDSAVQTAVLASGTNSGTMKLTVDGVATDNVAVTGWGTKADKAVPTTANNIAILDSIGNYKDSGTSLADIAASIATAINSTLDSGNVSITTGTSNGYVKLTVNGTPQEAEVKGINTAAYQPSSAFIANAANAVLNSHINAAAVDSAKLATDSVITAKIMNAAVTVDKMAASSVGSAQIIDGSIATADLGAGVVTNAKLAANSVASSNIIDGSVDEVDLAANSVTSAKIANGNITFAKMATGAVDATLTAASDKLPTSAAVSNALTAAVSAAVSSTTYSAGNGIDITSNVIKAIADATGGLSVAAAGMKIADSGVTTARINNAAVTADKLAADSVITNKLADSAVTSIKIADGTIATVDISDGAITSAKILDGTIAAADLGPNSVITAKIADSNVTKVKLETSVQTTLDWVGTIPVGAPGGTPSAGRAFIWIE
ncbi:MAG: hypothetical protein LBO08_00220 [Rickettsiales bacterium]|jgi:hypothetical protein|nr:hypothetical protein [Rickettsiales bacterium]